MVMLFDLCDRIRQGSSADPIKPVPSRIERAFRHNQAQMQIRRFAIKLSGCIQKECETHVRIS